MFACNNILVDISDKQSNNTSVHILDREFAKMDKKKLDDILAFPDGHTFVPPNFLCLV